MVCKVQIGEKTTLFPSGDKQMAKSSLFKKKFPRAMALLAALVLLFGASIGKADKPRSPVGTFVDKGVAENGKTVIASGPMYGYNGIEVDEVVKADDAYVVGDTMYVRLYTEHGHLFTLAYQCNLSPFQSPREWKTLWQHEGHTVYFYGWKSTCTSVRKK
jgi:CRISPR/Cas system-associated protein Cas7 (RAMP superfamily)